MNNEEQQRMSQLISQNNTLTTIIVSRNKLIEDLLVELPLSKSDFNKGLKMRDENWANDKTIWGEARNETAI